MPKIAVAPIVLNDVLLGIALDDYEAHVSGVTFTPTSEVVTWKGLTPSSVFSFGTTATWSVTLDYAQDWETANSLAIYLMENEGETVEMTFEPKAGGTAFTADVILTPGGIGGAVDTVATSSVTLGVSGKPVRIPAV